MNKSLTCIIKNRSHGPSVNSQTWASLQAQTTWMNGRLGPLEEPGTLPEIYTVVFLPAFPKGTCVFLFFVFLPG